MYVNVYNNVMAITPKPWGPGFRDGKVSLSDLSMIPRSLRDHRLAHSDPQALCTRMLFPHRSAPAMPTSLQLLRVAWPVPFALAILECSSTENDPAPFLPPSGLYSNVVLSRGLFYCLWQIKY